MINNSFSSGPHSLGTFNRSSSLTNEEYEPQDAPPSFQSRELNSFPQVDYEYGPREVHGGPNQDDAQGGSLSNIRPIQTSSNNMKDVVSGPIGEAPEFDVAIPVNESLTNGMGEKQYSDRANAPGRSKLGHENHSKTSGGEASSADGDINQADYVGISLVGKKFKEVNPTTYYVEKNDDLNQFM